MRLWLAALLFVLLGSSSQAQLLLHVESFTTDSLTISLSGTITGDEPIQGLSFIYISSPTTGWIIQSESSAEGTFDSDVLMTTTALCNLLTLSGVENLGDYISLMFDADLTTSSAGTGDSVTLHAPAGTTFNPSAVSTLTLSWGYNGDETAPPLGTYQSTAAVPEPATAGLLALALGGLVLRRRQL